VSLDPGVKVVHKLINENELAKVGAFIKHERELLDRTRRELAEQSGLSLGTMERIEKGRNTRWATLVDVIFALGYNYEDGLADFFADARDYHAKQRGPAGGHQGEDA